MTDEALGSGARAAQAAGGAQARPAKGPAAAGDRSGGAARGGPDAFTILQIAPKLNAGGVERGALEVGAAILAAGGRALIASEGGRMEPLFEDAGIELRRGPYAAKAPWTILRNAARLQALARAEGVHLLHARSRAPAWSALLAARRAQIPFLTTYHGSYSEGLPLKRRYNAVMAAGDRVIAISEFIAERIRALHGAAAAARTVVIPRGADAARFDPSAISPERTRALAAGWGVSLGAEPGRDASGRPILMLPGRLTRWKGQELFIDAMALLRDRRGPSAALGLIVGGEEQGGRFTAALAARIADRGLGDMVRLVGHCDDVPAALSMAWAGVSASLEPEAFGRVAVEIQAMATPAIASAHGGARETVADGETGWLVAPGDAGALADALDQALTADPDRRAAMGAAARARVLERYTTARMTAATLAVYEDLGARRFRDLGARRFRRD